MFHLSKKWLNRERLSRLRAWFVKYERALIPGALLLGFITDLLTFRFINFDLALLLLGGHILLAGSMIAFLDLYEAGRFGYRLTAYLRVFAPLVIQYSFGAMLSASVIFYSHSGSIIASWPFLVALVFLMVANELLRKHYVEPIVQFGLYFFAVFSIAILALPYLFKTIGLEVFIFSSLASLAVVGAWLRWLYPRVLMIRLRLNKVIICIMVIFGLMNFFYLANLIPPFPLAIREVGVYHSIERSEGGDYRLLSEEQAWPVLLRRPRFSYVEGAKIYVFSAIFAPTNMEIGVAHRWQYFDPDLGRWRSDGLIPFSITGGREEGFRGYTWKSNVHPGLWRVSIETVNGQVIGRFSFWVDRVEERPALETVIK